MLGSALDAWTRFENYAVNSMMYGTWRGCFVLASGIDNIGMATCILSMLLAAGADLECSTREAAKNFLFPISQSLLSERTRAQYLPPQSTYFTADFDSV